LKQHLLNVAYFQHPAALRLSTFQQRLESKQVVALSSQNWTPTDKGRKQRKTPFSFELRRHLYRFLVDLRPEQLIFATRHGRKLGRRNVLRDVKLLCQRLGITPPERTLHAFRHTFVRSLSPKGRQCVPSSESARSFNARDDGALRELADRRFASHPPASIAVPINLQTGSNWPENIHGANAVGRSRSVPYHRSATERQPTMAKQ